MEEESMHIIIETERMILRPMTVADAVEVFQWEDDPLVARYMVYNTYSSGEDVEKWLKSVKP